MVRRKKTCLLTLVLSIVVLSWLHLVLIPSFTKSYNNDCYLDNKSKHALEYMLTNIIDVFEKHNVLYWLDYGTLLGAIRYGGVLSWDADGDISFLRGDPQIHEALSELLERGISGNTMIAHYDGMSIDFMRWYKDEGRYKGAKTVVLRKYYPPWTGDNIIMKANHALDSFPWSWIGERKKKKFLSTFASVPEKSEKLLRHRYKWSYLISVPYKWKCYVPCFIYDKDESCKTTVG